MLSGLIVDNLSWRWLFVVGAVAIGRRPRARLALRAGVADQDAVAASTSSGAVLLSAGLIALLRRAHRGRELGLDVGADPRAGRSPARRPVRRLGSRRAAGDGPDGGHADARSPRSVLFTNLTALIAGFALFGCFVLIPNFVETPHGLPDRLHRLVDYGFGASATKAGLYLLPELDRAALRRADRGPDRAALRLEGGRWRPGCSSIGGRVGDARRVARRAVADPASAMPIARRRRRLRVRGHGHADRGDRAAARRPASRPA